MENLTYRFNFGNLEGFLLSDVRGNTTADDLVVNATLDELEPAVLKYGYSVDQIPTSISNLLLKSGNQMILVDTGIPRPQGSLFAALEELKIDPDEIDYVIITHSDMDHIGGILDEDGNISFPNAKHVMLKEAWQYWQTEESRLELSRLNKWGPDSHIVGWKIYSKIKDRMIFPESGEEFLPGFQLLSATGHRYDHSVLQMSSAGKLFMHLGDAIQHPVFLENLSWHTKYDADVVQTEKTKVKLLNMCAAEEMIVFATHFPFPGLGTIRHEGAGWNWIPFGSEGN